MDWDQSDNSLSLTESVQITQKCQYLFQAYNEQITINVTYMFRIQLK